MGVDSSVIMSGYGSEWGESVRVHRLIQSPSAYDL
jgi:hypothetical protein